MKNLIAFVKNEDGAVAIEYGLLAALIAIGLAVGMSTLKDDIATLFTNIGGSVRGVPTTISTTR